LYNELQCYNWMLLYAINSRAEQIQYFYMVLLTLLINLIKNLHR